MMTQAACVRGDPPVADLVMRAKDGDQQAWDALIERYASLVWSICRRYRLDRTDVEDVVQTVWLRLVDQLHRLRDSDALPGWLVTTTRRECVQVLDRARRADTLGLVLAAEGIPDPHGVAAEQELLAAERRAALREAFTCLPPYCQRLLALLIQDPPVSYAEISARLGISVGSIGPMRRRCLDKLRRHPAIAALINPESEAQSSRRTGQVRRVTVQKHPSRSEAPASQKYGIRQPDQPVPHPHRANVA